MLIDVILVVIGFIALIGGADLLVKGGSGIARSFGVKPLVIGMTIVAYGTSMPEFMASVAAMVRGVSGIALGNVLGSNIFNIAVVLGVAAMINAIDVEREVFHVQLPLTVGITCLVSFMILTGSRIGRGEGFVLFSGILLYTAVQFFRKRDRIEPGDLDVEDFWARRRFPAFLALAAGCILLFIGGRWVVDGSTDIAENLGISDRVIGSTLVALGTSLPELVTTLVSLLRREAALGIGNAIGSCIFNLLMVIGGAALVRPIRASLAEFKAELFFSLLSLAVIWILGRRRRLLTRRHGFILLAIYGLFLYFVLRGGA